LVQKKIRPHSTKIQPDVVNTEGADPVQNSNGWGPKKKKGLGRSGTERGLGHLTPTQTGEVTRGGLGEKTSSKG